MIPNSKFEDKAYMISELCLPFKADDFERLLNHALEMQNNCKGKEDFDHKYMMHLKLIYMRNIPALQKGTYRKIPFEVLNQKILSLVDTKTNEYPLMPMEGVGFDAPEKKAQTTPQDREKMRQLIESIRSKKK